jgi:hypothetical protein
MATGFKMTDWNFDDENIDPSMGDEYGYWSDRSDLDWLNEEPDDDFLENDTSDDEGYEDSSVLTKDDSFTQSNYASERMQSRLQIHSLWDDSQYESARDCIVDYLREMSTSAPSRRYYLRLILASFFSLSKLDSEGVRKSWNLFESFMKTTNLNVSKNEVIETRSKLNGLVVGFYADALDSDIQLASLLRNDFRRADLALVILKRHMINGVMNTPYFNNTLLATLVDLKMLDEAKPISENLMKFSSMVPGSIERVLATQCRYLLEVFVSTGDLDYLDEAGKIIDRMPGSGVEQSFYLKCLARYLSLRGDKDKSAQAFDDSQRLSKAKERVLAPSSFKLLESQSLENPASDLREFELSPYSLDSKLLRVEKSIPETLNELGFINVNIDSDQRANAKNWFFHTSIELDCLSGFHNKLHILRSHYEGTRLEISHSAHYFALFCAGCNLVSFTNFQEKEFKQYNNKLRSLTEKAIPIKKVCPTCVSDIND